MTSCYNRLINNLEDLKLNIFRDQLPHYISLIESGQKEITEALYELTELERKQREQRMITACVRTAGFPFLKEISDYDFSFQPSVEKGKILELSTLKFLEAKENIVF
ncbi:ATP-binding protein, partial [Erysipelotrichaceae bacterium RD49]|nr:ATP-binding protein [Erysipelotrichaceae bacterium RD49]